MFDMLASPTFTNRSHFGRLFPPNLALRRFGIPRLSHIAFFSPSRRTGLSHFACFPPSRAAPLSHFARFKPTSKTTSNTAAQNGAATITDGNAASESPQSDAWLVPVYAIRK